MTKLLTILFLLICLNGYGQTDSTDCSKHKGLHLFVSCHIQNGSQAMVINFVFHAVRLPKNRQLKEEIALLASKYYPWTKGANVVVLSMTKLTASECKQFDISR